MHAQSAPQDAVDIDTISESNKNAPVEACSPAEAIIQYLKEVPEFQRLSILCKQGWENPAGDKFFERQRQRADNPDANTTRHFYNMMKKIGKEMNNATGALKFNSSSSILDLCMAPGGFLATALNLNPNAQAVAFTLPPSDGGHTIFLPKGPNLTINLVDITMLAADIGIQSIPQTHPDATNFLPQHLNPDQKFDLALCDGQVLRPNVHHTRPEHRKRGEANRLTLTQLILALEHLKPGGAMVVLLHRVEAPETVQLLYAFDQFATVELFKPAVYHAKRSSFYMVATDVGAQSHEARIAIERWKRVWRLATFETEMGDTDYFEAVNEGCPSVEEVLERFGPKLVSLGRNIWRTQANALAKAPWMKKSLAY